MRVGRRYTTQPTICIGNVSHQGNLYFILKHCWCWLDWAGLDWGPTGGGEEPQHSNEPGGEVQSDTAAAVIKATPAGHFVTFCWRSGGLECLRPGTTTEQ